MKPTTIIIGIIFITLISSVSAIQTADYFYSPTCPHCQKVSPFIEMISGKYLNVMWNFYDVTTGDYDVGGVPTLIIDDNIILTGSYEIPRYAECYLKEMSTKECPTYSADTCTNDWFIRN